MLTKLPKLAFSFVEALHSYSLHIVNVTTVHLAKCFGNFQLCIANYAILCLAFIFASATCGYIL